MQGETNLKEIYSQRQQELELETVKYEIKLEEKREDHDKWSMGNTLATPMKLSKFIDGHELNWWDSEPLQTLRDPQTVRGSLAHKEKVVLNS